MAPSYSGVWNISTQYQYRTVWPIDLNLASNAFVKTANNDIEKFIINTTGNAADFAHATNDELRGAGFGNNVYAFWAGGNVTTIDRLTNASGGTATDFGDLIQASSKSCGISNNVRGIVVGGDRVSPDNFTVIEYVTMASTGNTTDFGDTNVSAKEVYGLGKGSTTRGVFGAAGSDAAAGGPTDAMSYITIASTGNSVDFGNLSVARIRGAAGNNSTRIVFSGGQVGNEVASNVMDYITIASTGNATDFGDTTETRMNLGGASSSTRSVFTGGAATSSSSSRKNTIDYITTATTGNATDFGDLTAVMEYTTANSDANPSQQNETGFPPAAMGLLIGGESIISDAGYQTSIIFLNITTDGQSGMFGDLNAKTARATLGTVASSTRAITRMGGYTTSSATNIIEYNTFSTKGRATDFGDLTATIAFGGALSNSTRGIIGHGSSTNVISYITIASTGNSTDFGDMLSTVGRLSGVASTTRGLFPGGSDSGGSAHDVIQYITIASTGNATDFGDLLAATRGCGAVSSNTRAVIGTGLVSTNVIQYVTIASTGNATDFGDATTSGSFEYTTGLSGSTIGLFHNYNAGSGGTYNVDKITIASAGNATDWGDLTVGRKQAGGSANAHGGL